MHKAIELGWEVFMEVPARNENPKGPQSCKVSFQQATLFAYLYDHGGFHKNLDIAINLCRLAIALMPETYPERMSLYCKMGRLTGAKASYHNDIVLLHKAIHIVKTCLSFVQTDASEWLLEANNLAARYCKKFSLTGTTDVADEAVRLSQEISASSNPRSPCYFGVLTNLTVAMNKLFEKTKFRHYAWDV